MTFEEIKKLDGENVLQTYGRFPVALDHGQGAMLYDVEGKEYVDFTSGIGVNCLGYGNWQWASAVGAQALKLAHCSNLFYSEPYIKLAKALCERSGMSGAFFANGGGEANEGMIKLARKYSFDKYGKGRSTIITLNNSFHGRTVTTLAATGQEQFHNYFFPFTEGFRYADANDIESVRKQGGDDVCAVMLELVQGEGGVLPMEQEFVHQLAVLCAENDWLLLVDEVQTGIGRTGTLFAYQQYGVLPDVVSFAKGIGGGLPLGGILANEKCRSVLGPGMHATTFGGNPIACAGGCEVLKIIDDKLLDSVKEKGAYIRNFIESLGSEYVVCTRGLGLMIGVQVKGATHKELAMRMLENGLLVLTAGSDALRLLPPLTITREEIDRGLAVMEKVLLK
jgi:acetylornithine/N-succinyldiaminopimelate aminotransferase